MTGLSRWWVGAAIAGLVATTSVPRGWYWAPLLAAQATATRGGSLVAKLTQTPLLRVDRATQQLEPWLGT